MNSFPAIDGIFCHYCNDTMLPCHWLGFSDNPSLL